MNLLKGTTFTSVETPCVILFDTFLLTVAPAIGYVSGALIPIISQGVKAQVVYQIDAMFNAFHHDAIDLLLPYCTRFDETSWWISQAVLIYRSLCVYGHVIQFNARHRQSTYIGLIQKKVILVKLDSRCNEEWKTCGYFQLL